MAISDEERKQALIDIQALQNAKYAPVKYWRWRETPVAKIKPGEKGAFQKIAENLKDDEALANLTWEPQYYTSMPLVLTAEMIKQCAKSISSAECPVLAKAGSVSE